MSCPICAMHRRELAEKIRLRLLAAGVRDRASAEALTIDRRDEILRVAAWGGTEDDAWEQALQRLEATQ